MAIFAGVAWGTYVTQVSGTSWLPLLLGAAAVIGNGCSFSVVTRTRTLRDRRAWANRAQAARAGFMVKHMASRYFSLVLLFFALVGKLGWLLWLSAFGWNR